MRHSSCGRSADDKDPSSTPDTRCCCLHGQGVHVQKNNDGKNAQDSHFSLKQLIELFIVAIVAAVILVLGMPAISEVHLP